MKPQLLFLVLAKDVLTDVYTGEITPVRVFDTFLIPKNQEKIFGSFSVAGRVLLGMKGSVTSSFRATVINPDGRELSSVVLNGPEFKAEEGININARFNLIEFASSGEYKIRADVSVNNGSFITVNSIPFWIKKEE
jgi:hypothetical protein